MDMKLVEEWLSGIPSKYQSKKITKVASKSLRMNTITRNMWKFNILLFGAYEENGNCIDLNLSAFSLVSGWIAVR